MILIIIVILKIQKKSTNESHLIKFTFYLIFFNMNMLNIALRIKFTDGNIFMVLRAGDKLTSQPERETF